MAANQASASTDNLIREAVSTGAAPIRTAQQRPNMAVNEMAPMMSIISSSPLPAAAGRLVSVFACSTGVA